MRGCPVGCRFCQAGYVYRPSGSAIPKRSAASSRTALPRRGTTILPLITQLGAYGAIQQLVTRVMDALEPAKVAVSLSSLHATSLTADLAEQIRRVRKTGFTIALRGAPSESAT